MSRDTHRARTCRVLSTLVLSFSVLILPLPVLAQTASPNLSVRMVDAPDPVSPGKVLTYRITVDVSGKRALSGITMTTSVPAGTSFVELRSPISGWTTSAPAAGSPGVVTATTPSLSPGRDALFQLTVRVSSDLPESSTIANAVTVTSATTDPNPDDNSASTTTTVRKMVPSTADLSTSIEFLQDPVASFGQIVETIVIKNSGPMAATDVEVRTTTPSNTTFVLGNSSTGSLITPHPGASGDITATIDVVPNDQGVIINLVCRVTGNAGQRCDAVASVSASSVDPHMPNNVDHEFARIVDAGPVADLAVSFSGSGDHVEVNSDATYAIVVTNNGPTQADSASALVPIPPRPASFPPLLQKARSERHRAAAPARSDGESVRLRTESPRRSR